MARTTTDDFPVKLQYFYIIDFKRFMFPTLMPVYFPNRNAAKRILDHNIRNRNRKRKFSIYSGKKIKKDRLNYIIGWGNYMLRGGKYRYPALDMTNQQKKSFRTLLRRRLRRMDLLTTNKVKFRYDAKGKKVKYRKNYQRVAKSPNTDAKVFQLDRKPKYIYYIILKKQFTSKAGKLFKIRCIRVNIKNGVYKKVTIYTQRNDIFLPELLENLKKKPNAKSAVEAYTRAYSRQQKKVL